MLGFLVIILTCFMIFTLVRNALNGTQLAAGESYQGTIELIIPLTEKSEFYLEAWINFLNSLHSLQGRLKIHILIDGHHPAITAWQELHHRLPYVELHNFPMRPADSKAMPWMIQQIGPLIKSDVVIIGDPELLPNENAFFSLSKLVSHQQRPYFALPQTAHISFLGESIAVVNPTLALASVYGFKKYHRNLSHPLMSMAQGWMAMPLKMFQDLRFGNPQINSWKQEIVRQWDRQDIHFNLAFGEKHLIRHYPAELSIHLQQLKIYWEELWSRGHRSGPWLYIAVLFIWSFPLICFISHPFWSMATISLLVIYRFFSKIIFQESWGAVLLHPFGCLVWIGTFIWWALIVLKSRSRHQAHLND